MVCSDDKVKVYVRVEGFGQYDTYDSPPIQLRISKNKLLRNLKTKIAKEIKANSIDEFTIKRQGQITQMKELDLPLISHGINSGAFLHVQKGTSNTEGKFEIEISLISIINGDDDKERLYNKKEQEEGSDKSKEETVFHKKFVGKLTIKGNDLVSHLKNQILE